MAMYLIHPSYDYPRTPYVRLVNTIWYIDSTQEQAMTISYINDAKCCGQFS